MDKTSLVEKQTALEQQFEAIKSQKDDLERELILLQGEYRLVQELIKQLEQLKPEDKHGK